MQMLKPAGIGHFNEFLGQTQSTASDLSIASHWQSFIEHLGVDGFTDLDPRTELLERQIRDNGVTYNVYADSSGPQRPWSLDLLPLIIDQISWQQIQTGVLQRVKLLDRIVSDVYGPQTLLKKSLLPPALVQGHPGYLRSMHGYQPLGQTHLHVAAFDLSRGPDGNWWIISQRMQAPSGLGYLLENRLSISRLFPQAFDAMPVQRLASVYQAWIEGLKRMSPAGGQAHVVLLTPGPYNETYFEHAYLARYLGISLVQGSDLLVRDQRLYLKTLQGLEPVHIVLKRVDDVWMDPLELRPDSTLGVPGLLQAIKANHVLMVNAPGTAFLESPAMMGFMPALSEFLLSEKLLLPSLPTWWCGETAALHEALPRLNECVIKPTYEGSALHELFQSQLGRLMNQRLKDEWSGRILRQSSDYTLQSELPLSQTPTWRRHQVAQGLVPKSFILRVFALSDGPSSWRVLPGGLTRLALDANGMATMQRGGSSADTWVLTDGEVDTTSLLQKSFNVSYRSKAKQWITSRAGSNLFWLGRYTERTENSVRLVQLILKAINGEDQTSPAMMSWLGEMAKQQLLMPKGTPTITQAPRVFERSIIASLCETEHAASVGFNLRAIKLTASAVRERLSHEQWSLTERAERDFFKRASEYAHQGDYFSVSALRVLESTSSFLAAMTGAQTDRMTRDDGWRLLSVGRQVERLGFFASALASGLEMNSLHDTAGFESMIALFDSTITFHYQFQQNRQLPALLDLLVLNTENPRSLAWVIQTLRGRLSKLAGCASHEQDELARLLPDPSTWNLDDWCEYTQATSALLQFLKDLSETAWKISDRVSLRYFSHAKDAFKMAGF